MESVNKPVAVFDFDGVIANTMPSLADAAIFMVLEEFQLSVNTAEEWYWRTTGVSFADQIETLIPLHAKDSPDAKDLVRILSEEYENVIAHVHQVARPHYDVADVFAQISDTCEIYIVSGTDPSIITSFIDRTLLDFSGFVSTDKKRASLEKLARQHDNVFYFDDAPWGAHVAKELGIQFYGIDHHFPVKWPDGTEIHTSLGNAVRAAGLISDVKS